MGLFCPEKTFSGGRLLKHFSGQLLKNSLENLSEHYETLMTGEFSMYMSFRVVLVCRCIYMKINIHCHPRSNSNFEIPHSMIDILIPSLFIHLPFTSPTQIIGFHARNLLVLVALCYGFWSAIVNSSCSCSVLDLPLCVSLCKLFFNSHQPSYLKLLLYRCVLPSVSCFLLHIDHKSYLHFGKCMFNLC